MTKNNPTSALSRRTVLHGLTVVSAATLIGGCSRVLNNVAAIGTDVKLTSDLAYGPHERHRFDLYMPEGADEQTPLILFLYGGSWKWGSRARYGFVGYSLAERGFAVAVADYRLYPEVKFPTFNYDAARALSWLQNNRRALGFAPGSVHLVGHSAGAHIAALVAMDPSYLKKWGSHPDEIASVVGLAGPYSMHPSKIDFIADIFPPAAEEAVARPVEFVDAKAPPMLLLHGLSDGLVSPKNTENLRDAMVQAGGRATAVTYEKLGHKEIILALTSPFQGLAPVLEDVASFINKHHR